ncbi:ribosome biogenesis/translation initiation ATPase RLI [Picrophilus oshimae]|uniref:ATP-binding cassette, sub-family E, member 1 n=1 Tax=Picrophilus torridus (strain ATCC 700027 / DSM 9790 / JCM 10055 / NBRC 100828 / KAW 2/3) TaxID=1122961 RepID=Q6L1L2_PICTO|nr:ribosome biogenesis/translation initiation ATPase RLI [Picrophilus oshimae]AAT43140.1 RNase L inhibitor homolog, predicted ATPase [Picrophilus oshimae DSM 9789]SMD30552.1 ATP-binding cassette, sub-family E, member 1 [Picrophilus oshimae DSM 9789]
MHIAILDRDRCHPKKCNHECRYYCPPVRSGSKTIEFPDVDAQPVITENLCIGCGICVRRCPFNAIKIVTIPDELNKKILHQYGLDTFRLYSIPMLSKGKVSAILGQNALGKTTTLNILSGIIIPNFGNYNKKPDKDGVIEYFSKSVMGQYFKDLYNGNKKAVLKSQYVDMIPRVVSGTVRDILNETNHGNMDEIVSELAMENYLDHDVRDLSGGELQKLAIARSLMKDGDIYLFDEMTSYLDIGERLRVSNIVKRLSESKIVMIVEHDLAILDKIADEIHLVYGEPGAYGVITQQKSPSKAINSFLEGYLKEENVRIRPYSIEFSVKSSKRTNVSVQASSWESLYKRYKTFELRINPGFINREEIIGILGENALGKTTFVKMLAGVVTPDNGSVNKQVKVAYKPQYISSDYDGTVYEMLSNTLKERLSDPFIINEIMFPLNIEELHEKNVSDLSGGELQRLSIALTLSLDADLYLIDEPSAHLDASYRINVAKIIRRAIENSKKSAIVVDHDIYLIDLISDALIVFKGSPGRSGESFGPMDMRSGMNLFLKDIGVTFRRDEITKRPRINKTDSALDREQKEKGEYYYI